MAHKILSPMTRIEGHLAIETEVENGVVKSARTCGEMYRGFENIMKHRSPMDAARITQRICGVCHEVHGIAAARALAGLYQVEPPNNGKLLLDIILALHMACDHMLHFYHLSVPDYIDFTALAAYKGNDPKLNEAKNWVIQNKPALFAQKVPGDYITKPNDALPFVVHYVEALEQIGNGASALASIGGKTPFCHTIFPGGVSTEITIDKIARISDIVDTLYSFTKTKYLPDIMALASHFSEYFTIGSGYHNLLCYGGFSSVSTPLYDPGVLIDHEKKHLDTANIKEETAHSFYSNGTRHFSEGETVAAPDKPNAYSWIKSPRYLGEPLETGPLSRVYMNLHKDDRFERHLKNLGHEKTAAFSTMGRHLARCVETAILLEFIQKALVKLSIDKPTINTVDLGNPVTGEGTGLSNAGRGELLHYVKAVNGRVDRYQCVVPSTWNFSPRDSNNKPGPVEKALENTPIRFESGMIEVGRVIRSFDPCLACSIH